MSKPPSESTPSPLEGVVIHKSSRDVRVDVGAEVLRCEFRGRMREREAGRVVVVGDRVAVTRLADGDWFLREIVSKGKVLYEKSNSRVGSKSRRRLRVRR